MAGGRTLGILGKHTTLSAKVKGYVTCIINVILEPEQLNIAEMRTPHLIKIPCMVDRPSYMDK